MIVRVIDMDLSGLSADVQQFVSSSQTCVTPGKEYAVHAISSYEKIIFALIIDDLSTPVFIPVRILEVIDGRIPDDWECNLSLGKGVDLVVGPRFIAGSLDSYGEMVDQELQAVEQLWSRVHNVSDSNRE